MGVVVVVMVEPPIMTRAIAPPPVAVEAMAKKASKRFTK